MSRTVLVTGGAGYIGSVLVRRLLDMSYSVICLDNLKFGGESLLGVWSNPRFRLVRRDISKELPSWIFHDLYAIVHLAGLVGDPACSAFSAEARLVNSKASIDLLSEAIVYNVPRFIFASTCSNYGKVESSEYANEETKLSPVSLYANLKVGVEDFILNKLKKTKTFSPTCLRFATAYGASPRMRFDLTVNEFTKTLVKGEVLKVYGKQFWRPYCHVDDIATAIFLMLEAPTWAVAYNVFNVGSTEENYTKDQLVFELKNQIPEARVEYVERKEDSRDYKVDFSKIRQVIPFRPSKTVPDGIREIIQMIRYGIIRDTEDKRYYNV